LSPELLAALRDIDDVVYTLAGHKPNWISRVEPSGVYLETERSKGGGAGAKPVPAWMIEAAWQHLRAHGELTRAHLVAKEGLNVKRASAVCALLARLPGVEVASIEPITLRLSTSDDRTDPEPVG
jgi:hypothetical protein